MTLSGGANTPTTGSFQLRKTEDGLEVVQAPQRHTFPRQFLERELNDSLRITLDIAGTRYEVLAFEHQDLVCNLLTPPSDPAPSRQGGWQKLKDYFNG